MTETIKVFADLLVESYNKYIKEFLDEAMAESKDVGEKQTADFVNHRWGDRHCELLGKTPKDAIGDILPEEIEFDDIIYLFENFAVKTRFDIPYVIIDLLFSAPDIAEKYVLSIIENMDLSINADAKISNEENKKSFIFMEALNLTDRISADKAKEVLFRVFDECDEENNSINEMICEAMTRCGFVTEMISFLDNRTIIGEKEHFILQELVHIQNNESVFKCLKSCLKKNCDNIAMTVQIVSDCGDGRLIPLMRKIAKNEYKSLLSAGKTPFDHSSESNEFMLVCNAIVRLGGSIEDIMAD